MNPSPAVRCFRLRLLAAVLAAAVLCGAVGSPLLAENEPSVPEVNKFGGRYLGKAAADLGTILISPAHWRGKDFAVLGAAAGLTVLFFVADPKAQDWVADHPNVASSPFSLAATRLGEPPFLVGLTTVLYLGGEAFKDDDLRKTALLILESYVINSLIVNSLKFIIGRSRPYADEGAYEFNMFSTASRHVSFPSGHSSAAFAVASVIAGRSDSVVVGTAAYGLASLVAVSRVINNKHWVSDVFVGSLLGFLIGKQVLALNDSSVKNKPKLSVAPAPGGFSLALSF